YACLLEVVQAVNSTLQLQVVLNLILDRTIEVMQADAGSIMILDESTGELQVKAARGARAAEVYGRSSKLGEGIAGWVALYGQPHTMERLLSSLVWAQEEERKRVSLEIHDGPAQTLYAALIRLQAYRALREGDQERAAAEFAEAEQGIRETLSEIRRLIFDLR